VDCSVFEEGVGSVKESRDRLRNKLFRFLGLCPDDDFMKIYDDIVFFADNVSKLNVEFKQYGKAQDLFNRLVAERLHLEKQLVDDTEDRGVYQ